MIEESESSEDAGWMAIEEEVLENFSSVKIDVHEAEKDTGNWMLDSGASRHMTYQRSIFIKFTSYCAPIRIANGQQIWSEGRGNVSVEVNGQLIHMTDVLYVCAPTGGKSSVHFRPYTKRIPRFVL